LQNVVVNKPSVVSLIALFYIDKRPCSFSGKLVRKPIQVISIKHNKLVFRNFWIKNPACRTSSSADVATH